MDTFNCFIFTDRYSQSNQRSYTCYTWWSCLDALLALAYALTCRYLR